VAFAPDGQRVAVADRDSIILCDASTGDEVLRFQAVAPVQAANELMAIELRLAGGHRILSLAFSRDGRWLVAGGADYSVRVWDVAAAKEVLRLDGHDAGVSDVAFGPDGKTVFSAGKDGQAYLWSLRPRPATAAGGPLGAPWTDLDAGDAQAAYRAVWALADDPRSASFLRDKLTPAPPLDRQRLAKLVTDLDSDQFRVRESAKQALADLGRPAIPALEEALTKQPALETRQRLQALLDTLRKGALAEIRSVRAAQALELAGTPEARATLRTWAGGAPGAALTDAAAAALKRLEK
jgi:hypothetical protein